MNATINHQRRRQPITPAVVKKFITSPRAGVYVTERGVKCDGQAMSRLVATLREHGYTVRKDFADTLVAMGFSVQRGRHERGATSLFVTLKGNK